MTHETIDPQVERDADRPEITVTATWRAQPMPGQREALLALLFAPRAEQ